MMGCIMTSVLYGVLFVSLAGIVVTVILGLVSQNVSAIVNGIVSIAVALSPGLVEYASTLGNGPNLTFGPALSAWIAVAGLLHMMGMLGWYDTVWWWDHLTHTISAAFVAALVYASLQIHIQYSLEPQFRDVYVALITVLFTLTVGVFWEFIELAAREVGEYIDRPPVLEYYGLRDTIFDMIFNGIGALVIVAFDVRVFVSVTEQATGSIGPLLFGSALVLFFGSVCLGVVIERLGSMSRDSRSH